ncbi:response regulator transcription factor [Micromonospora polyrhachis]|uniref:DNA-binding NarL/FixJ family response regulator n=1 Tax=Micromonospora polyrhachis TaxID=1282883 RepID=A0A7W7SKK7_9ACTN|nr:response regulator transcription factor [Micromonospora polyrhachis]MBB4956439.1 DNA-binding NarL/FixJ family response regulator [Micromonospora polyrhachis]
MDVAVADDGALFREGLQLLLSAAGHRVVGCVEDGDQLLELLAVTPVEVAIMDIRMPPGLDGGLDTAQRIRARYPRVGMLLLSQHAEAHYLYRLLEIGTEGIGYRLKDQVAGVAVLADTLVRIAARELVIEPALAVNLVDRPSPQTRGPLADLTDRERGVLRLMAEGRSNAGIAGEMFLSVKSVEKHIASIFAKLKLSTEPMTHHRRVLAVLAYLRSNRMAG